LIQGTENRPPHQDRAQGRAQTATDPALPQGLEAGDKAGFDLKDGQPINTARNQ
jgi:hypothetical protein